MRVDSKGLEMTHDEAKKWVTWHIGNLLLKKVPAPTVRLIESSLWGFFAGAAKFQMTEGGDQMPKAIYCPKCHGNGHSNLYPVGGGAPLPCDNCKGSGVVYPGVHAPEELGKVEVNVKED